uniref:Uncharacterized protein n=1 Tax=Sinocyclocheilus anshuiensis TaxID=1608454 RepID=A0A671LJ72_9TELE
MRSGAEIQQYLKSGGIKEAKLSSSQWSAVVFVLLTSEEDLNEFCLDKFGKGKNKHENMKVLQKLLPVIKEYRSVQLSDCGVTDEGCCAALASALRSNPSHLRELDLTRNKLGDSGVTLLSAGLEDPHCKLEILRDCDDFLTVCLSNRGVITESEECVIVLYRLKDCGVTDEGCAALASALRSNPSHRRHLDLSWNKIGDLGVKLLCAGLKDPHCKLEELQLSDCGVKDKGCAALASALRSNPSHLRHLDLSWNKIGDLGVNRLCAGLKDPHCKLEILWLRDCGVTDEGCVALASALRSNSSLLRHLNLTGNKLGKSGVKLLKENPHYKLETVYCCEYIII